ncbi:tyrosine-type recombinase/integrase [Aestuariivirga sp.]|uniref:tyrosine-type recombinase/integrase n=1 Tax=Aestuariivirga sp. TaxID=2650926 RepID=UPI0039E5DD9A
MSRKSLSDIGVSNLKPRAKRYTFPDPEMRGHYVRVTPAGVKSYAVVTRDPHGRQVWATIGSSDAMRIEEARERGRKALQRIRDGLTPFEPTPKKLSTFEAVAKSWIERHVQARKLRSQKEIERCLRVYVLPAWKDVPFVEIRRGDVTELLDRIEDDNGARQADVVLAILRGMANWYASRHDEYLSPVTKGMRRQAGVKRDRVLGDEELRVIWRHALDAGTFGAIIRFALLTAQRREKIAKLRWSDLDGSTWNIASGAREKGAGGSLRLPKAAKAVIDEQPRLNSNPFVFSGRGDVAFNGFSKCKARFDEGLPKTKKCEDAEPMPRWTLHDLRRTARSLMSRAGVRPDIAERVLGHVIPGVEGVYDRHRYDAEKAEALERLAATIDEIRKPAIGKIVRLTRS